MYKIHKIIVNCIILIAVVMVSYRLPAHAATTYYVSTNGTDSASGTSWADSFLTISNGLANAAAGDSVLVSNGTYSIDEQLVVDKGVTLTGVNGRDFTTVMRSGLENHRVFMVTDADAVVEGLTVSNGLAQVESNSGTHGGGIYLTAGTVRDCRITHNRSGKDGSQIGRGNGIYMSGGIVSGCEIDNNTGTVRVYRGGGIYMTGGVVSNCLIRANKADETGGGIYAEKDATILDSRIVDNEGIYRGGGMVIGANTLARNCLIAGNLARHAYGGGIHFVGTGIAESCTIVKNHAKNYAGGVEFASGSMVSNSIVYFNTITAPASSYNHSNADNRMQFSCTTPEVAGTSNTFYQPRFVDLSGDDFRLTASPCIDTGANQPWMVTALDLDGNPRITGGTVDMGCYESIPGPLTCRFDADPLSGIAPLEVDFEAFVSGTNQVGLVYYWDFDNDGLTDTNTATSSMMTHTYPAGTHSGRLTVSNAIGESATWVETDYIQVAPLYVYVSTNGSNTSPYDTWEKASNDIQAAVDAAVDGSTIFVSNGVYMITDDIAIIKGVTVKSVNGYKTTTVQSDDSQRCFYIGHEDAILDGFTLTRGGGQGDLGTIGFGGAVRVDLGGTVQNCWIENNQCLYQGGGVYLFEGGLIRNSVIFDNRTTHPSGGGGGLAIRIDGVAENCTIISNKSAAATAGGFFGNSGGTLWNTIVWDNTLTDNTPDNYSGGTINYSCSFPLPSGDGNIGSEPIFADAANADLRLLAGSPGIDAGTNMTWMIDATDLDGNPRIKNRIVDMGAYEYQPLQGTLILIQ